MPDLENIIKWILALRSPQFTQTHGALETNNGFCCLGVACAISGVTERIIQFDQLLDGEWCAIYSGASGTLPDSVATWLGVNGNPQLHVPKHLQRKTYDQPINNKEPATALNDTYKFSFAEISDCVVETYGLVEQLGYVTKT